MSRVTKVGRVLSAVVVSVVAFSGVAISQASATSGALACTAIVLRLPHPYSVIAISVSTTPDATVSATETAGKHTWSMTAPNGPANSSGKARLTQKMAAVRKYELVRVSVHVNLDGSTGHCTTRYSPPSLVPQN